MSPRTFARRFRAATGTTPHRWILRQRLLLAQRLLETTDEPVGWVATRCGFATAAGLRMHFSREVGASPSAYRHAFRGDKGGDGRAGDEMEEVAPAVRWDTRRGPGR